MTYLLDITYNSAHATLTVWEEEPIGSVSEVRTKYNKRRNGDATEVMKRLIIVADSLELNLILEVIPFGPRPRLEVSELKTFYEKFGFVSDEEDPFIMKRPFISSLKTYSP